MIALTNHCTFQIEIVKIYVINMINHDAEKTLEAEESTICKQSRDILNFPIIINYQFESFRK